jgi:hypothetical protein
MRGTEAAVSGGRVAASGLGERRGDHEFGPAECVPGCAGSMLGDARVQGVAVSSGELEPCPCLVGQAEGVASTGGLAPVDDVVDVVWV